MSYKNTKYEYFIIEVIGYSSNTGFSLSEKDGWFVGNKRFCGNAKAREFSSLNEAQTHIDTRNDQGKYNFIIHQCLKYI